MKRFFLVLLVLSLMVSLSSCTMLYTDEEINEIYMSGYEEGFQEGTVDGASHLEDYILDASSYPILIESLQEARETLGNLHVSSKELDEAISALDEALYYASEFEHEIKWYDP